MTVGFHKVGARTWAWVLAVLIAGVYLFLASRATLWDRDEPRFARATVEMLDTGNVLVPTFNGELRPDKPILIYWLMAIPVSLLGQTELACRFWGAVGTAVTCLLVFSISRKLFDAVVGLWAMAILASSLMVLYIGTAATADAVLLPLMVGQMAVFTGFYHSSKRITAVILMGLAIGGALLAKGPVGLLPLVTMFCMMRVTHKERSSRWRFGELALSLCLGVGLFLAWALPANAATQGEFLRLGLGHHVLQRSVSPLEHHGGTFLLYLPYYLPVILIGFFPWTLFLPGVIAFVGNRQIAEHTYGLSFRALFFSWTLPVLIIMTLVATKLPHYILFVWPMLALGTAAVLVCPQRVSSLPKVELWLKRGVWFFLPIAALCIIGLLVIPWIPLVPGTQPLSGLPWPCLSCAFVLAVMTVAAVCLLRRGVLLLSAKALIGGTLLFQLLWGVAVIPVVEQVKISPSIAKIVKAHGTGSSSVATYIYEEPTLNFYINRQLTHLKSEDAVLDWATLPGEGFLILPRQAMDRLNLTARPGIDEIGSKTGINYVKGDRLEVVVLSKSEDRSLFHSRP